MNTSQKILQSLINPACMTQSGLKEIWLLIFILVSTVKLIYTNSKLTCPYCVRPIQDSPHLRDYDCWVAYIPRRLTLYELQLDVT